MKRRAIPARLARLVEELERDQPAIVTTDYLKELAERMAPGLSAESVAQRLVRQGWLLPLRTRHAWEFAPGARAGSLSSGDPWIELRALLAHQPRAEVAIAFESAVWELGYSSHRPTVAVLARRKSWKRDLNALNVRIVSYDWRLPVKSSRGLPVWMEATIVVAAAARPSAQGDWANADAWMPVVFRNVEPHDALQEAEGRGVATLVRLGYLAEWAGREDIAHAVSAKLPGMLPVTFLGNRAPRRRWVGRWGLYDNLLPAR
jgi:hypothetical protein